VITGRGPGAPGVTPGVKFTRGRVAAGDPGDGAVDLSEIRRSEEIVGVLAARAATPAAMLHDPAVALLSALTADIDARDAAIGARDATPDARPTVLRSPAHARRGAAGVTVRRSPGGIAAWVRAAAAGAVVAGVAGTTSVVTAGMLARLARGPASGSRGLARDWSLLVRPRRTH
jgi:hypothetical protein